MGFFDNIASSITKSYINTGLAVNKTVTQVTGTNIGADLAISTGIADQYVQGASKETISSALSTGSVTDVQIKTGSGGSSTVTMDYSSAFGDFSKTEVQDTTGGSATTTTATTEIAPGQTVGRIETIQDGGAKSTNYIYDNQNTVIMGNRGETGASGVTLIGNTKETGQFLGENNVYVRSEGDLFQQLQQQTQTVKPEPYNGDIESGIRAKQEKALQSWGLIGGALVLMIGALVLGRLA